MSKLIIVRHGESSWNKENRFTGWMDVPLSKAGIDGATKAGKILKNYRFDKVYVSHMSRAIMTLQYMLNEFSDERTPIIYHEDDNEEKKREHHAGDEKTELPIYQSKAIAERYYGDLQGLIKSDIAAKFGEEQLHIWRRSFDIRPPNGESLKDTLARVIPYWKKNIMKDLNEDKTILIVAHGNSLRAIVKYLEDISDNDIPNLEISYSIPIEYVLDSEMKVLSKKELK